MDYNLSAAIIKIQEAELILNRCLCTDQGSPEKVNETLIKLTAIRIDLEDANEPS